MRKRAGGGTERLGRLVNQALEGRIPWAGEQGIFSSEQGIVRLEQGSVEASREVRRRTEASSLLDGAD